MLKLRVVLVAMLVAFAGAVAATHTSEHSVKERLKPTGSVYKEGDNVPVAVAPVAEAPSGPRDGATIYTDKCAMCHEGGVAGAPKTGDVAGWTDRVEKGEETLYKNAIVGINAMPAKGMCMDCSDDEIKAAVDYLLLQLQ
ncbi:cytochrome c5 family protein [Aliikangiella sp. IMCC44653]